jgi:hypothetical protein
MPGTIRRTIKHRANRKKKQRANRPQPTSPIGIVSATPALEVMTIVFDQPVMLNGVPQYTTDVGGASPVSAALTNPTTLALTFDADVALATVVNIPHEEPAVRNASGGFVTPRTFPV